MKCVKIKLKIKKRIFSFGLRLVHFEEFCVEKLI